MPYLCGLWRFANAYYIDTKRRALDMIKMDYLRLLVDEAQGKYIDWRNFL